MTARPTGRTAVAAVIGDPIRHSRSPQIFNAAFAATGLDWVYVALEVPAGEVPAALEGMRALGLAGMSVTMPHKAAVATHLARPGAAAVGDDLAPAARRLGAVNSVERRDGALIGHNTDGAGFVASLRADAGFDPAGRRCVVVGAGGAARALVLALADAGAADVVVANRTRSAAERAAELAGPAGRVIDLPTGAGPGDDLRRELAGADLLVNATPVGMDGASSPVDASVVHAGQLVADIIVEPVVTPLLREAAARGAATLGGLGMLARQAAVSFEIWTGLEAPIEVMVAAAGQH